jgi:hypothetical protein
VVLFGLVRSVGSIVGVGRDIRGKFSVDVRFILVLLY